MSISPKKRRRDGRVVYEVRLRDPAGREYSRTFDTRKAAEAYQTDQRAQRLRGTWVDPRRAEVPLEEVAAAWLKGGASKRGSGLARDESIVRNHLLPVLGARPLGSIMPRDVQSLVGTWTEQKAPRTVRRQYGVLTASGVQRLPPAGLGAGMPARRTARPRLPRPQEDQCDRDAPLGCRREDRPGSAGALRPADDLVGLRPGHHRGRQDGCQAAGGPSHAATEAAEAPRPCPLSDALRQAYRSVVTARAGVSTVTGGSSMSVRPRSPLTTARQLAAAANAKR